MGVKGYFWTAVWFLLLSPVVVFLFGYVLSRFEGG